MTDTKHFAALEKEIKELKGGLEFGAARKRLTSAGEYKDETQQTWVQQQLALCTYKDEELPPAARLADALKIVEKLGLRDRACKNAETLALGGAIYKRRWLGGGTFDDLNEALAFYRAAWERNKDADMGYGGVNAAYLLDIQSNRTQRTQRRSGTDGAATNAHANDAGALREDIRAFLEARCATEPGLAQEEWFAVTLGEVYFGLRNYLQAEKWLATATGLGRKDWEQETTFRQLAAIARLHGDRPPTQDMPPGDWPASWRALRALFSSADVPAFARYHGRMGLALSGGGFRASFYHLGVLARLAEMDVLRGVDVLSTVSGGSIVGAHYYLELKRLLEKEGDHALSREDYIGLVRQLQVDFLDGVQCNLRCRILTDFGANLRLLFSKTYTRSQRLGELYEQHLYARVKDQHKPALRREMAEQRVAPHGEPVGTEFKPRYSNWRRRAKVPVLVLNATSLNSGHTWQFTARSMGEPPGLLGESVDINERYRRLHYDQAPTPELQHISLGSAVAASSCVPGLFEPLVLANLYQDRTVRLVDGGVHDNQGTAALLDEACSLILCSDASGQMDDQLEPADSATSVPLRANSILMDRVRETQYEDLCERTASGALDGVFFIHLKQDLETSPRDWLGCDDPSVVRASCSITVYGIDRSLQRALACMRTDLDAFTEVEAHSLMLSGYLMAEQQMTSLHAHSDKGGVWENFDVAAPRGTWQFRALERVFARPANKGDAQRDDLDVQIKAASRLFFKAWTLCPGLKLCGIGLGIVVGLLLIMYLVNHWHSPLLSSVPTVGMVAIAVGTLALVTAHPLLKWLDPKRAMHGIANKLVLALLGYAVMNVQVLIIDKMFLRRGKLERLLKLPASGP